MRKINKKVCYCVGLVVIITIAYALTHYYSVKDFTYVNQTDQQTNKVAIGENPVVNVDNSVEVQLNQTFNPSKNMSARDKEDGRIPNDKVKINSNVDTSKEGVYKVTYDVTDSDNNKVQSAQTVVVNDGSLALGDLYIMQAKDITIKANEVPVSKRELFKLADLKLYNKMTGDVEKTNRVKIEEDTTKDKPGTYKVAFVYDDDVRKTIKVTVVE